jgi:hypothetical protein
LYFLVSAYGFGSENIAVANYKTCQLAYARGTINAFNDQTTTPFMETVDYVKQCTPQSASLLVFPEGNGINYLSGRFCPMRYDNYLPNILNTVGEDKIVRELNEHPSDFVVLVHRNTYEHGYRKFGFDYGMQIVAWINCNYEPVALIGDMPFSDSAVFGTAIYRKKAVHGKPK